MHPWFTIEELLAEVFGNLGTSERRSLANAAVTCRTFYEPAMDRLWSELDDLFPLIKCMAPDLWNETRDVSLFDANAPVEHTLVSCPTHADASTALSKIP